jgi:tRNA (adenine37-N6)-methyltransferase
LNEKYIRSFIRKIIEIGQAMEIIYKSIGVIHTSFNSLDEMPIQPTSDASGPGVIEVFSEYADALRDLEGFSHIYLLYHFHKVRQSQLIVTPFLDSKPHGIFATRAPTRPNPLGLSLVKLVRIDHSQVYVEGTDVLNGTPLLDIKPFVPEFESVQGVRIGWLEQVRDKIRSQKSDDRFG